MRLAAGRGVELSVRLVLGGIFLLAGVGKFQVQVVPHVVARDLSALVGSATALGILRTVPVVEAIIGAHLLLGLLPRITSLVSVAATTMLLSLSLVYDGHNSVVTTHDAHDGCGCLGRIAYASGVTIPSGREHTAVTAAMLAAALLLAVVVHRRTSRRSGAARAPGPGGIDRT